MGLGQHTSNVLHSLLRPPSWQGFGALLAGAAVLADQTMFSGGLPGPIDARMTIPTTNRYLFYNAGLRMHMTHSVCPVSPCLDRMTKVILFFSSWR